MGWHLTSQKDEAIDEARNAFVRGKISRKEFDLLMEDIEEIDTW